MDDGQRLYRAERRANQRVKYTKRYRTSKMTSDTSQNNEGTPTPTEGTTTSGEGGTQRGTAGGDQQSTGRGQKKYKGGRIGSDNGVRSLWKTYKGATESFGAVLGTKAENGPEDTMATFQRHGELWMRTGGIAEGYINVVCIMRDLKRPDILDTKPPELNPNVRMGSVDQILHAAKVKRYGKCDDLIDSNVPTLCNVLYGGNSAQCYVKCSRD